MMYLGFSLRLALSPGKMAREPRFSVQGVKLRVAENSDAVSVDGAAVRGSVKEAAEGAFREGYVCGNVTNIQNVRRVLEEHGLGTGLDTDSQCISRLYELYGIDGFRMLEGLFVAVFVAGRRVVLVSGKTPGPTLYYHAEGRGDELFVSTELKALPERIRDMRSFDELSVTPLEEREHRTCLSDVWRVPAGHCVEIDLREVGARKRVTKYFSTSRSISVFDEDEAAAAINAAIANAVNSYSGESANCLISGGLDSSIVAYLAKKRFGTLNLFSVGSEYRNEFDKAAAFATSIDMPFERVLIEPGNFLGAIPFMIDLVEHQFSTFVEYLVPVYVAHSHVGNTADIMLSGYGSDVLFAGFAQPRDRLADIASLVRSEYQSTLWSNEASQTLGGVMGAEVGYPFFESSVVETSFAIDPYLKHKGGVEKFILRKAFEREIDPTVLFRPKVGIHEGTGFEDAFTHFLGYKGERERLRRHKDLFCYEVLRQILIDDARPEDIDLMQIKGIIGSGLSGGRSLARPAR